MGDVKLGQRVMRDEPGVTSSPTPTGRRHRGVIEALSSRAGEAAQVQGATPKEDT